MAEPKADSIKCDVPGCHRGATYRTDGKEKDVATRRLGKMSDDGTILEPARDEPMNRPAVPKINVCAPHKNWPHSEDAQIFALGKSYKERK
jgi:hypothetical protein